jgi:hypothetical protein
MGIPEPRAVTRTLSFVFQEADLHVEVDPVVNPRSMRLQVYTGDYMSMQGHTVMSGSS